MTGTHWPHPPGTRRAPPSEPPHTLVALRPLVARHLARILSTPRMYARTPTGLESAVYALCSLVTPCRFLSHAAWSDVLGHDVGALAPDADAHGWEVTLRVCSKLVAACGLEVRA